jgi:hypothetical protein
MLYFTEWFLDIEIIKESSYEFLKSMKQAASKAFTGHPLHGGFLLSLLFNREDEGDMFLRNYGRFSTNHEVISQTLELFRNNHDYDYLIHVLPYMACFGTVTSKYSLKNMPHFITHGIKHFDSYLPFGRNDTEFARFKNKHSNCPQSLHVEKSGTPTIFTRILNRIFCEADVLDTTCEITLPVVGYFTTLSALQTA